jgi:phosphoserine phosphatase
MEAKGHNPGRATLSQKILRNGILLFLVSGGFDFLAYE